MLNTSCTRTSSSFNDNSFVCFSDFHCFTRVFSLLLHFYRFLSVQHKHHGIFKVFPPVLALFPSRPCNIKSFFTRDTTELFLVTFFFLFPYVVCLFFFSPFACFAILMLCNFFSFHYFLWEVKNPKKAPRFGFFFSFRKLYREKN